MKKKSAHKSLFIGFEGTEGAGKSTQILALYAHLAQLGYNTILTREPGGTDEATALRTLLKDATMRWSVNAETLLFAAARNTSYEQVIKPNLAKGTIILCDRTIFSSLSMQGHRPSDMQHIIDLHREYNDNLWPDLVCYLNAPAAYTLERARARHGYGGDRLEQRDTSFFEQSNRIMQDLASNPAALSDYGVPKLPPIETIDAMGDIPTITARVIAAVTPYLPQIHTT